MSARRGARHIISAAAFGACVLVVASPAPGQSCPGDCNGNGAVSLQEAVLAMRIALDRGGAVVADCPAADSDLDGSVSVADALRVTMSYQSGCGSALSGAAAAATSGIAAMPSLEVSSASGAPGEVIAITSSLHTAGQDIAGVEQEIHVDGFTPFVSCAVNPAIDRTASAFALRPNGCMPGVSCTSIKALILSFSNLSPIPDGSVLFTCQVQISGAAPGGSYPLDSQLEGAASPFGDDVPIDAVDGLITVSVAPTATPTPVPVQASLILEKVRLKADTSSRPGRYNGQINARGVVNANDPFASFVEDIDARGISVRVFGAGGVDETLQWSEADCEINDTPRGPRIRCDATDAGGKRKVDFRTTRVPNLFRANLSAKRLDFPPPLTAGSVAVVITTTTFERSDRIGGCKVSRGGVKTTCRESGFVPTPTPTFTPTPIPTATFTTTPTPTDTPILPDGTTIVVGNAIGIAGGTVSFTVGLETDASIAGIENELHLDPGALLTFASCAVNPAIDKDLFLNISTPSDLKALVLSFASLDPIPNGSIMYSCEVGIGVGATAADYLIDCTDPGASDPSGNAIPTDCSDGVITVVP